MSIVRSIVPTKPKQTTAPCPSPCVCRVLTLHPLLSLFASHGTQPKHNATAEFPTTPQLISKDVWVLDHQPYFPCVCALVSIPRARPSISSASRSAA